jgi:ribosomal protein S18 acetylase RimI-like enzyme
MTGMSGRAMTCCNGGAIGPLGTKETSVIFQDAKTLEDIMREAIRTSPDSFITTLVDVASKKANDWIHEIESSTWVVAERHGRGVGVAACKSPEPGKDQESGQDSRYIESVWIDPDLRGRRLGERLIRYLMAAEFRKNPDVRQFLLWVFETNEPAINLYERMDFVLTGDRHDGSRPEIKYRLDVNPKNYTESWQAADEVLLGVGKEKYGVTYKVLGEGDSA